MTDKTKDAGGGESQGGAYPNDAAKGGFSGGQSEKPYHGAGQLGDDELSQGNANAPAEGKEKDE